MQFARMVLVVVLIAGAGAALAQDKRSDARLEFSSTSFGLLLGFSQGQGALEFRGQRYPFSVSGIKVATLGVTRVSALGQVYRLRDIADFPGRYYAAEGAFTVGQGGGSAVLRNEKGVMLYLQNAQQGIELTLGGGGIDIKFAESATASSPAATQGTAGR
ncbi:MAG TPA: hypothetical protein PKY50_15550 [Candidatus Competibacter sp.]|nr:hypothetical protein [Candidatus Competibacter sp.]